MIKNLLIILGMLSMSANAEEAIFAMGCFWSGESAFRDHDNNQPMPGITDIKVGYAGGTIDNPTYENHPGYKEAIKITFDPKVIPYAGLLDIFWHNIDTYNPDGQFCDLGFPYSSAIFYTTPEQKVAADNSKTAIEKELNSKVVTQILEATTFYNAEEYHQNYAHKNPISYGFYRAACGRDDRIKQIWDKEPDQNK